MHVALRGANQSGIFDYGLWTRRDAIWVIKTFVVMLEFIAGVSSVWCGLYVFDHGEDRNSATFMPSIPVLGELRQCNLNFHRDGVLGIIDSRSLSLSPQTQTEQIRMTVANQIVKKNSFCEVYRGGIRTMVVFSGSAEPVTVYSVSFSGKIEQCCDLVLKYISIMQKDVNEKG